VLDLLAAQRFDFVSFWPKASAFFSRFSRRCACDLSVDERVRVLPLLLFAIMLSERCRAGQFWAS
jgi:hypothetical protein